MHVVPGKVKRTIYVGEKEMKGRMTAGFQYLKAAIKKMGNNCSPLPQKAGYVIQPAAKNILIKSQNTIPNCINSRTMEQISLGGCGIPFTGGFQEEAG